MAVACSGGSATPTPTGTAPAGTAPTGTAPTGTAPTGTAPTGTASDTPAPAAQPGPTPTATPAGLPPLPEDPTELMWIAYDGITFQDYRAIEAMAASGDRQYLPVLAELRHAPSVSFLGGAPAVGQALRDLAGGSFEWISWIGAQADLAGPPEFDGWMGRLLGIVDEAMGRFLYPDVPHAIRLEEIV